MKRILVIAVYILLFTAIDFAQRREIPNLQPFRNLSVSGLPVIGNIAAERERHFASTLMLFERQNAERERLSARRARQLFDLVKLAGGFRRFLEKSRAEATRELQRLKSSDASAGNIRDAQAHIDLYTSALTKGFRVHRAMDLEHERDVASAGIRRVR